MSRFRCGGAARNADPAASTLRRGYPVVVSDPDIQPRRVLRALRHEMRRAGVPAALRSRVLRRAGVILRQDHALVEEILRERDVPVEEPHLYEVLLEAAVRADCVDELDVMLRLGAAPALGVTPADHGARVAALNRAPRPPPAASRGGEGFGVLQDLYGEDGPTLLGSDHGPSTPCPACAGRVRLEDTRERRDTKSGVHTVHGLRCPRCLARGEVERFYSHRLRGNRDRARLDFPGLLGPLASREWTRRTARVVGLVALVLAAADAPWEPWAHLALVLTLRTEAPGRGWEVLAAVAGPLTAAWAGWWRCAVIQLAALLHAAWAFVAEPSGWQED